MNRLTLGISALVLAAAAIFLLNPPAMLAQPPNCAIMGQCTVEIIASGDQLEHTCVPTGPFSQYCGCPYTDSDGWGYTYDLLSNTCPYPPAPQY